MKKNISNKISLISYLIANGISVPHYCYHNDLPIAGNCRVCLVELKNSMKPVVSCATNAKMVLNNNSVYHDSALVRKARENILEFLLLNHPIHWIVLFATKMVIVIYKTNLYFLDLLNDGFINLNELLVTKN